MTALLDIGVSALINVVCMMVFVLFFMIFSLQPMNDRVYRSKLYIKGLRKGSPSTRMHRRYIERYLETEWRPYLMSFQWICTALRMSQDNLIEHAGLDAAIFLRIYTMGHVATLPLYKLLLDMFAI